MASTSKCEYCGSTITSEQVVCPNCGAANPNYVAPTERTVFLPRTIEELKEYCAERGMPLLRMRFFIGEDYKEPKAFGIYQDGDDFIVYKNKADGKRAVRYKGPDEEYAVSELFHKLLDECHLRGIYPDGKPGTPGYISTNGTPMSPEDQQRMNQQGKKIVRLTIGFITLVFVFVIGVFAVVGRIDSKAHREDGYYVYDDDVYYRYGSSWYHEDSDSGWTNYPSPPSQDYQDHYAGTDYDSDWGGEDFKSSSSWKSIQDDHSVTSNDFSNWDAGDTDWDSDW